MSKWREQYKVHPAADVFPMMTDAELDELGKDIKANGLKQPIIFQDTNGKEQVLLDGRNRLEAMERAGIGGGYVDKHYRAGDPVALIISLNIRRRHLTKHQQADLIVAAVKASEKLRQLGEVSKGGRGKVDAAKAEAVSIAKVHGIGKRTVERAFAKVRPESDWARDRRLKREWNAKANGKTPAARRTKEQIAKDEDARHRTASMTMAESLGESGTLEAARHCYLIAFAKLDYEAARKEAANMADELTRMLRKCAPDERPDERQIDLEDLIAQAEAEPEVTTVHFRMVPQR
jgi:hypothetical protein